jgi:hypothetical protein
MLAKPVGSTGGDTGGAEDHILIREEQVSGVQGGTFSSGAWQTRILNTKVYDTGGHASLAVNQITLLAGTYRVEARCPAYKVVLHKTRLRNITDGTDAVVGSSSLAHSSGSVANDSFLDGRFTISTTKVFELQHRCSFTYTVNGFGAAVSFGVIEVYSAIEFWKEA